eukprot:TRINITY_DN5922_c0_g1_i1.p1 TRINITY_DN5922_c0_g1~~TRINITY_DN5922_c0_g1_i1.p1  ORF type:complete len:129 (-),score=24.31 TRINITY_DN5922_c0_g1_i1:52-438(-)
MGSADTMNDASSSQLGEEVLIWSGTTWPMCCFSPFCCSSTHWKITNRRVDVDTGCCKSTMDVIDIRRITDIKFHRSCTQMCINRGTITIYSDDNTDNITHLTCFGAKEIFKGLREAWTKARLATAVSV